MNTVRQFAETVAPLYIGNNWLSLGNATLDEAVKRVETMTGRLYRQVRDTPVGPDYPYYFVSTGRVKVIKWYWDDEPTEIEISLKLETEVEDEGEFVNIYDERYA